MEQINDKIIESYWLKKLSGELPKISLPFTMDAKEEKIKTGTAQSLQLEIPGSTSAKLFKSAKDSDIALFILLLSGLNIVLEKYTGIDDLIVGTIPPAINSNNDNIIFCRNNIPDDLSIKESINQAKEVALEAINYSGYPVEKILEALRVKNNITSLNIFSAAFIYEPFQARCSSLDRFDLIFLFSRVDRQMSMEVKYSSPNNSREMVMRFCRNLIIAIDRMLDDPAQKISCLDIVSPEEKNFLLYDFNNTKADYPGDQTLHALFRVQISKTPDNIAIAGPSTAAAYRNKNASLLHLTYKELNEPCDRLAQWLKEKKVGPDTIVGLMAIRSIEMIIGIMGILKAGGAYLPIEPDYPEGRKQYMLKDCGAKILLTHQEIVNLSSPQASNISPAGPTSHPDLPPAPATSLAYIIYTSGSTGKPKGVMVEHRSLVNYLCWARGKYIDINDGNSRFPLFTLLSFDLTVTSIFVPLLSGNTIIIYEEPIINKIIEENRVQVIKLTPSHLKMIVESDKKINSTLKRFIVGGEKLDTQTAVKLVETFENAPGIFNEYGPTEAAVGCMIYKSSPGSERWHSVPIGHPADNVRIFLLDKNNNPVPMGAAGEIYIAGDGVARGYLNRPELTAEKFLVWNRDDLVAKKVPGHRGERIYRTGDFARFLPDGNIEFIGRIDHQVKIRGVRIELEEIRDKLMQYKKHDPLSTADIQTRITDLKQTRRCSRCLLPANYPNIHFDKDGICNICSEYEKYKDKAGKYFKTNEDFYRLVENARKTKKGGFDCLLLFSGGKDSSYVLYQLADMGLKALTFTFDNGYISEAAFDNIKRISTNLGVENIVCKAENMNRVFVESLHTNHNVCHGCWNVLNTMGVKFAGEKGINLVISGLSRGQIFEMRLEGLFQRGIFTEDEIEENLLLFRKTFHSKNNKFSRILNVELAEDAVEQIQFVDFFRYFNVPVSGIKEYLAGKGWVQPGNTGFCSSNCVINDIGIYVHLKEKGYHFYAAPLSWDCRLGSITREQGLQETGFEKDLQDFNHILNEIGYYRSPVKDTVIVDKEDDNGNKYLTAYIVSEEELVVSELREYLSTQLPDYMIPSHFLQIEKIPLTPNGKVDRDALDLYSKRINPGTPYTAPRNDIEKKIVDIWKQTLKLDRVGIHDNYFELGGTSFDVLQINRKLKETFGVNISIAAMFRYTTVHTIANYLNNEVTEIRGRAEEFKRGKMDKMQRLRKRIEVRSRQE
jgi:amino acid adenylation domain-containing protein